MDGLKKVCIACVENWLFVASAILGLGGKKNGRLKRFGVLFGTAKFQVRSFEKDGHVGALSGLDTGFIGWLRGVFCIMGGGRPFREGGFIWVVWEGCFLFLMWVSLALGWALLEVVCRQFRSIHNRFIFFEGQGVFQGGGGADLLITKVFKTMELKNKTFNDYFHIG